ncbi:hypothetical protein [Stenotrophomonas maltophilia]|uniref:hypothetical protein n=1 Tax=Stenotrophomonas maltophilia TaxID=40324 RepID=UPI00117F322B|nr:hypothetical protein [Stenotrophomonas maltophilia]
MGDFERTFGAGANLDSIIGGFNRSHFREQRATRSSATPGKKTFKTFREACDWAKKNPGRSFSRVPGKDEFEAKG